MKNASLVFLLLLALECQAQQQQRTAYRPSFRLNPYAAYVFSDKFDSYYSNTSYYNGKVNSGFQWGAGLEWMVRPSQGIEFTYLRLDTRSPTTFYDNSSILNPVKNADFELAVNYLYLGSTRYFSVSPYAEPFFGLQFGMAIIDVNNPETGNGGSGTKFVWGIKGGTNIWASRIVGIKLQAGLASVTQAVGGGLYFSSYGAGTGVYSYSTIFQFSLGGGLVFKLGG